MRFKFNYTDVQFNMSKWTKLLDKQLTEQLKICGQFWVEAAISKIPLWRGASRGTFLKLANKIGYQMSVAGPTVSKGIANSSGTIATWGGAYTLIYSTHLLHLVYNEYNNANAIGFHLKQPGPYNFQVDASQAFIDAAKMTQMPSFRPATKYIKRKV